MGEITPSRLTQADLDRPRLPTRVEEIRELVRLARLLGGLLEQRQYRTSPRDAEVSDLRELVRLIYSLIGRLDTEPGHPKRRTYASNDSHPVHAESGGTGQ